MSPSERELAGFALAATIAKDPGAQAARSGLADAIADTLTRTARELAQLSKAERRARIRALTEPAVASPTQPVVGHPRALALLAHKRGLAQTPAWLRDLPLPRPGFAPEPALMAVLTRIALRSQQVDKVDN